MKQTTQLENMLKSFYLSAFVRNYDDFAKRAEKQKLAHMDYLFELAQAENEDRQTKRTARLLKQARLPRGKVLEDLEVSRQPGLSKARIKELTEQLAATNIGVNYQDWRVGVVTERNGSSATIGFASGDEASRAWRGSPPSPRPRNSI